MNKKVKKEKPTEIEKELTPQEETSEIEEAADTTALEQDDVQAAVEKAPEEKSIPDTPVQPIEQISTEPVEPLSNLPKAEVTPEETAKKITEENLAKEKLLDRQLELLWGNGRKQLLSEPSYAKPNSK